MAYFDFNFVTDPPNDELVDVETQLNDNFTELDSKLQPFRRMPAEFGSFTIPKGTEAFDPDPTDNDPTRIAVYNGTEWARNLNYLSAWTSWQSIGLRAPFVARTGFPPKCKINAVTRQVVLKGGVQINSTADPWNLTTTYEITDDTSFSSAFNPVFTAEIRQASAGQITTANGYAGAVVYIRPLTSPDRTAITIRYQGDAGGGNFVMLDGVSWWY